MRPASLVLAVLVMAACLAPAPTPAASPAGWVTALWDAHRPGVAELMGYSKVQSSGGTGFLARIGDKEVLITNAHVASGVNWMSVRFDGLAPLGCKVIDSNPAFDLAALQLVDGAGKPKSLPGRAIPLFPNTAGDPKVGSEVVIIGHPERLPTTIHDGIISAEPITLGVLAQKRKRDTPFPATRLYQLNLTSTQGFSGAPVLDREGRVVGVMQQGWQPGLTDINFCIPHTYLYNLNLGKQPVDFPAGPAPYENTNQASLQGVREPGAKLPDGGPARELAELGCRQWGVLPKEPRVADFIFERMVGQGNRERFQRLVPYDQLKALVERHRIVHLFNPAFNFGFLVPDNYKLSEELVSQDPKVLKITLTNTEPDVPAPYNRLCIYAKFIDPVTRETLEPRMREASDKFPVNVLGLRIHPPAPPGFAPPPPNLPQPPAWAIRGFFQRDTDVLRVHGGFSDDKLTTHPTLPIARLHIAYDSFWPARNTRMIHYVVSGSVILVTEYEYPTFSPTPGVATKDFAERRFIAETVAVRYTAAPAAP